MIGMLCHAAHHQEPEKKMLTLTTILMRVAAWQQQDEVGCCFGAPLPCALKDEEKRRYSSSKILIPTCNLMSFPSSSIK